MWEAVRAEVRALDYVRGTPAEQQEWREADADARHNNVIEGLVFSPGEDALFDMLRDEAVPPDLATQIILRLHDHPDADRSLAITPVGTNQLVMPPRRIRPLWALLIAFVVLLASNA